MTPKKSILFAFISFVIVWGVYESTGFAFTKSPHFVIFTVTTTNGEQVINIGASNNEFYGQEVSRNYLKSAVESGKLPLFFIEAWNACEPLTNKDLKYLQEEQQGGASKGLEPICKLIKDGKTTFIVHRFLTSKPCAGERCEPWKSDQFSVGSHTQAH